MTRQVIDRTAFLSQVTDVPKEDVALPEFGNGTVIPVWGMTALERSRFEKSFAPKGKTLDERIVEFRQRLVVACCKNDDGVQIFTSDDIVALGNKSAKVLERIVNAAQRLSGMTNEDIEATVKNSETTQSV
jgi:propanediol dehydratase large subunit